MIPRRYRLAPARARPVVGLTALALGGLALIVWSLVGSAPDSEPSAAVAAPAPPVASGVLEKPTPARTDAPMSAVARDSELVEVCALGWLESKGESAIGGPALFKQIPGVDASLRRIVADLRESPDAFAQAAGILVDPQLVSGGFDPVAIERLARLAVTTEDARAYSVAFRACSLTQAKGSCALLNSAQWARLDDGNAEPWLFILAEAAAGDDRAQVDEALYRIGSAKRFEDRFTALAAPIAARAGTSDADLVAAQWLAMQATVVGGALPLPLQPLTKACGIEALADLNRKQVCDTVAATLGERSDTILVSMIGASMGKRVGWPIDRVLALRALLPALPDALASYGNGSNRVGGGSSCADVRADLDRLERFARVGEAQVARDWIAANGKTLDYARVARENELKRSTAEAEAAASRSAKSRPAPSAS